MVSIKNAHSYEGTAWDGDSLFHQNYDFPSHVTERLLSLSPMSGSVK
jgi:hypothetical protein